MDNVPFNKRSLRSLCASISKDHSNDDVRKTYELFSEMKKIDPNFVDSCQIDKDGRIRALMWTSGKSRMQYKHFGDAITFDTTYRTNRYDMPFGLFVGVNNHFQSIILGGVLLTNETSEAFEWVFSEFVKLMGGKAPATILTDQCRAMEIAISIVLPHTTHMWCKWHVLRKAKEFLGPAYAKNAGFRDELHKICNHMLTVDEFESAWAQLIEKHGLHDHPFLTQIYDVRMKWAKPYFSGVFCARMTSTQRSESANHMLKIYVPPGSSMNMFVKGYNKLQFQRDEDENYEEKRSRLGRVLLNSGGPIEKHASKIYTPNVYNLFEVQIFQSASYTAEEIIRGSRYIVVHFDAEKRERWSRGSFEVRRDPQKDFFRCDCGMYEHMGIICSHVIRVLSYLGRTEIPESHVMQRWTKNACRDLPEHLRIYQKDSPAMQSTSFRHTALYRTAIEMVQLGDSNPESFEVAMSSMLDAIPKNTEASRICDGLGLEQRIHKSGMGDNSNVISDHIDAQRWNSLKPDMIAPFRKTDLGRPTSARAKPGYEVSVPRTRFCTICRSRGHNSGTCPSNDKNNKKPRRESRCSNCGITGHKKNACVSRGYMVMNQ
ncbi:protein FAR1-RELATED SEQUENCE 5 [Lolium perenne]|uniref:protein FAR1-RELATED SEQUENCE 5 n=1 Tax=Lolium perenne TaxID=4522 RepID=UPI0021F5CB6E|nr:protein FAR1-RELATED SEQUENCE 5-like [Lolium perenne]XP_051224079.1 protein FAR1-RELATED SEQUENCE 5-like [Lolium perenne]XP_051224080.1 protein FAR1-RELATED SEQUENCE 5-like [Lolium perenne]